MNRLLAVGLAALAVTATVAADLADARRLGGGRSFGAQRQSVAPPASPSAAPAAPAGAAANPVMPTQPGAAAARAAPGAAAAAAPAARGASRWLGPVAGLAAGLGLAALAAHLGMSEALMSMLLIGLMVFAGIALLRFFLARRGAARPPIPYAPGAGAGTGLSQRAGGYAPQIPPPSNARGFEPVMGGAGPATAAPAVADGRFPPGFEPAPFLQRAREQFSMLQAAYDTGDRAMLADVMTPELFGEVSRDLDARGSHIPTEVVALHPEIVEVTTEGSEHWASVRFSGLLREDGAAYPKPFDEMWNLVKPIDGSTGWLLAGIRQLDPEPTGPA